MGDIPRVRAGRDPGVKGGCRRRCVGGLFLGLVTALLCISVRPALAQPARQVNVNGDTSAMIYLFNYGYMGGATNPQNGALMSQDAIRTAIIDFQAFANLNQTGVLDPETITMMNTPRCGNRDLIGHGGSTRRKRYALQGSRWRVRDLTYKVTKYPSKLAKKDVDREIAAAFKVWEDVSSLTFKLAGSGKVHIEIRFAAGEHGDGDAFDGRGGTLAHAYFPIYGGDAHFDDQEYWTIKSFRGTNLFQVAAHEFGHSLGLSHSDVKEALMAPFYKGYQSSFLLDKDDRTAIQALYGTNEVTTTARPDRPKPVPTGDAGVLCGDSRVDAIVTMADKKTYVFKGAEYWQLTKDATAKGYPKPITSNWGGLPSRVDAAFSWANGKTYFFKGDRYWRYSDLALDAGYPKPISKGFAGIPANVDGAFVWSGNGKIYFFKGSQYWKFDPAGTPPVKETYPKDISIWEGIPNNIDDALQYENGYTYFFKKGQYWRFNDRAFKVDSVDPPFPRDVGTWWFGCDKAGYTSAAKPSGADHTSDSDVHVDSFDAVLRIFLGLA